MGGTVPGHRGGGQGTPTHSTASLPQRWPADAKGLGLALSRLRGSLSLRQVEQRTGIPKTRLSRYENGQPLPKEVAVVLDEVYGAAGWLVVASERLVRQP